MRINKYISMSGELSRRKADKAIEEGRVYINGRKAVLGDEVNEGDEVRLLDEGESLSEGIKEHFDYSGDPVSGRKIENRNERVTIKYFKPKGQVCTSKEADEDSIFNYINYPVTLRYVGRLDKDSEGLLLLTNDGDLANAIQKSVNGHEKEYIVRVNKDITDSFIKCMSDGVQLEERVTKKCKVTKLDNRKFRIILTEGINRQIRRMCETFGYRVVYLKRIRVMNVRLGDMKPGEYRVLTSEENRKLNERVNDVN